MTQPTNERSFGAPDRVAPVRPLPIEAVPPMESTLTADPEPLPPLKIWASYPDGSSPESVEIVVADPRDRVTVSLIAGILRALERPSGMPSIYIDGPTTTTAAVADTVMKASGPFGSAEITKRGRT